MPGFHQPVRRYAPQGALASFENGGGKQLTETYDYNNRLQVVRLQASGRQKVNICRMLFKCCSLTGDYKL